MYIVSESHGDFYKYEMANQRHPEEDYPLPQHQTSEVGTTIAAYVAFTKDKIRCKTSDKDSKYPAGLKDPEVIIIQFNINLILT